MSATMFPGSEINVTKVGTMIGLAATTTPIVITNTLDPGLYTMEITPKSGEVFGSINVPSAKQALAAVSAAGNVPLTTTKWYSTFTVTGGTVSFTGVSGHTGTMDVSMYKIN